MHRRLGIFQLHCHIGHVMLHCLKGTHRLAELLAIGGILHRQVYHTLRQPQCLCRCTQRPVIQGPGEQALCVFSLGDCIASTRHRHTEQLPRRVHRFTALQLIVIRRQCVNSTAMLQ